MVRTATIGIGEFGEVSSLPDRAFAARAMLLAISTYTLVLAALFAERRHNEVALEDSNNRLKNSNDRLQLALDGAELGVWSLDAKTGRFESDARDGQRPGRPTPRPARKILQRHGHSSVPATCRHWTPPSLPPSVLVAAAGSNTSSLRLAMPQIFAKNAG